MTIGNKDFFDLNRRNTVIILLELILFTKDLPKEAWHTTTARSRPFSLSTDDGQRIVLNLLQMRN